jgi:hypothetical protein
LKKQFDTFVIILSSTRFSFTGLVQIVALSNNSKVQGDMLTRIFALITDFGTAS